MNPTSILRTPSQTEIIEVIDQNLLDLCSTALELLDKEEFIKNHPKADISVHEEVLMFFTGINHPSGNTIMGANFTGQNIQENINTYVTQAKQKDVPFMWWVGALSKPPNIGDYLEKTGLIKIENPGMYLNLSEINETKYHEALYHSKIKIVQVLTSQEEKQWIDICITAFKMNEMKEDAVDIFGFYFKCCDSFLATLDGKPVGVSLGYYGSGVAGIYCVGVLPEYRKRGIGKAITMAPLLQAKKKGYEISVLTASPLGFSVYANIGYQECCKYQLYMHSPPNPKEEH